MKRIIWMGVLASVLMVTAAYAVPPAYQGPLGNDEEPALRPYKWLYQGLKAFLYQPVVSLRDGNLKTPGLGTVEVFRGLRRGMVELDEDLYRGLIFSAPPASSRWKELGAANKFIEGDVLLLHVADALAIGFPWSFTEEGACALSFTGNTLGVLQHGGAAAGLAAIVIPAQICVDCCPLHSAEEQKALADKAAAANEAREERLRERRGAPARMTYLGEGAAPRGAARREGNLLKLGR